MLMNALQKIVFDPYIVKQISAYTTARLTNIFELLYKFLDDPLYSHTVETEVCVYIQDTWLLITVG